SHGGPAGGHAVVDDHDHLSLQRHRRLLSSIGAGAPRDLLLLGGDLTTEILLVHRQHPDQPLIEDFDIFGHRTEPEFGVAGRPDLPRDDHIEWGPETLGHDGRHLYTSPGDAQDHDVLALEVR